MKEKLGHGKTDGKGNGGEGMVGFWGKGTLFVGEGTFRCWRLTE